MWNLFHLMSGKLFAISSTRSSQYGMVMAMPFDLVAEVRCFFGVLRASSKANFSTRSTPTRLITVSCTTTSRGGAGEHLAADRGIFALGVLAHHPEVDVAGLAVGERRRHAGHQPHRAQIDVLVELAAEQNERAPQRDVVGNFRRPADRAEDRSRRACRSFPSSRPASFSDASRSSRRRRNRNRRCAIRSRISSPRLPARARPPA